MKTCTLRLIDAYAGNLDLLVVVLWVLVLTTNGASPWTTSASSAAHRILELLGIDIGGT